MAEAVPGDAVAAGPAERPARAPNGVARRVLRGAGLAGLAVVAVVVAVAGSFMHRWAVPLGLVLAVGGAIGVGVLARRLARTRVGIALPGVLWLATVLVLAQPSGAGDVVIGGDPEGLMFLFGGASGIAVLLGMGAAEGSSGGPAGPEQRGTGAVEA